MLTHKERTPDFSERDSNILNEVRIFIKKILKFWWLILIIGICFGLLGFWYASNQDIKYRSTLTFALDDDNSSGSGVGGFLNLAAQLGFSTSNGKDIFAGDNITEIMKSRRMIEKVLLSVDTFNNKSYTLIEYFLDITKRKKSNSKLQNIHFSIRRESSGFSYQQDSVLYKVYLEFSSNYIVAQRPDRKLNIFEVNVTSPDEKFTKDFTDRLISETNSFYTEIRTKKAKETLDILEQRLGLMKESLNLSITKKSEVQDININPAFTSAQVPVLKQQTNIQVYGAAYGEMFKNLELARFNYLNEIPLMQIIDNADYPMEEIKFGKLKAALLFAIFAELLFFGFWALRRIFSH